MRPLIVISTTDPSKNTPKREYDSLGQLTALIYPAGGITSYSYDNQDNLIVVKDAEGQVTSFEYGQMGHKTKEIKPLGKTISYI